MCTVLSLSNSTQQSKTTNAYTHTHTFYTYAVGTNLYCYICRFRIFLKRICFCIVLETILIEAFCNIIVHSCVICVPKIFCKCEFFYSFLCTELYYYYFSKRNLNLKQDLMWWKTTVVIFFHVLNLSDCSIECNIIWLRWHTWWKEK